MRALVRRYSCTRRRVPTSVHLHGPASGARAREARSADQAARGAAAAPACTQHACSTTLKLLTKISQHLLEVGTSPLDSEKKISIDQIASTHLFVSLFLFSLKIITFLNLGFAFCLCLAWPVTKSIFPQKVMKIFKKMLRGTFSSNQPGPAHQFVCIFDDQKHPRNAISLISKLSVGFCCP